MANWHVAVLSKEMQPGAYLQFTWNGGDASDRVVKGDRIHPYEFPNNERDGGEVLSRAGNNAQVTLERAGTRWHIQSETEQLWVVVGEV